MDFDKIRCINNRISKNREKLNKEKDPNKRERLNLKLKIDEFKIKLERLKK